MPRSPRLDFPGACHLVTARGNRGQNLFRDAEDSEIFLERLAEARDRFRWQILSYCLLPNHYHLAVETPGGGLARGMRHINGTFTQRMNRKYATRGHLFEGRYKAVLVDRNAYLKDVIRYIALRPVRAGLTDRAEIWRWGSYRDILAGRPHTHADLTNVAQILSLFDQDVDKARASLQRFVEEGATNAEEMTAFEEELLRKNVIGKEKFIASISEIVGGSGAMSPAQASHPPLETFLENGEDRRAAMARAYLEGGYTLQVIADAFGVHESTVSRAVKNKTPVLHT